MANYVVLIEGNICAGKTTLVNHINENKSRFDEFLGEGESINSIVEFIDQSWLQLFYQDRKKYSSWFEKSCLIGRIGRHFIAKAHQGIVFFDRGMLGGGMTFCKNSFDEGFLRYDQWSEYQQMLRSGLDDLDRSEQKQWMEQLLVYLRLDDIEKLEKRNAIRNTEGENIPTEYLIRINHLYEKFIDNIEEIYDSYGLKPPNVLTFDASVEFLQDSSYLTYILDSIINHIRRRISSDDG